MIIFISENQIQRGTNMLSINNLDILKKFMGYFFGNIIMYGFYLEVIDNDGEVGIILKRSSFFSNQEISVKKRYKTKSNRSKMIQFGKCQSEMIKIIIDHYINKLFNEDEKDSIFLNVESKIFSYAKSLPGKAIVNQIYEIKIIGETLVEKRFSKKIFTKKESIRIINIIEKSFADLIDKFKKQDQDIIIRYLKTTKESMNFRRIA